MLEETTTRVGLDEDGLAVFVSRPSDSESDFDHPNKGAENEANLKNDFMTALNRVRQARFESSLDIEAWRLCWQDVELAKQAYESSRNLFFISYQLMLSAITEKAVSIEQGKQGPEEEEEGMMVGDELYSEFKIVRQAIEALADAQKKLKQATSRERSSRQRLIDVESNFIDVIDLTPI